jgi:hypothetical protein
MKQVAVTASFAEVVGLIEQARRRAYQAVNAELVGLYWQIGEYISGKLASAFPFRTFGACGSCSRRTRGIQNSHHW